METRSDHNFSKSSIFQELYESLDFRKKGVFISFFESRFRLLPKLAIHEINEIINSDKVEAQAAAICNDSGSRKKMAIRIANIAEELEILNGEMVLLLKELKAVGSLSVQQVEILEHGFKFDAGAYLFLLLPDYKMALLNKKIELLAYHLPTHPRDVIYHVIGNASSYSPVARYLFSDATAKSVRGMGEKAADIICRLKPKVEAYTHELLDCPEERFYLLERKYFIEHQLTWMNCGELPKELLDNLLDKEGNLKLFSFLDHILRYADKWSARERMLLTRLYTKENSNAHETEESFSLELGVVPSRLFLHVKRWRYFFPQQLKKIIEQVKNILGMYPLTITESYAILPVAFCEQINQKENVQFNPFFYEIIFSILLEDSCPVIELDSHKLFAPIPTTRYLFSKDFVHQINIFKCLHDLSLSKQTGKIEAGTSFEDFVRPYIFVKGEARQKVIEVCRQILL